MYRQQFEEATMYRGVLDVADAAKYGRYIRAFRRHDPTLFFNTPINAAFGITGVSKAWLTYPEATKKNRSIATDYLPEGRVTTDWGITAALKLMGLCDVIDEITETASETRFLQSYAPGAVLIPHDDVGETSRIVGLLRPGNFNLHDPEDPERILRTIEIMPGDVLHFMAKGLHSAVNPSLSSYRETINLIDLTPAA